MNNQKQSNRSKLKWLIFPAIGLIGIAVVFGLIDWAKSTNGGICGTSDYKVVIDIIPPNDSPTVSCNDTEVFYYCTDSLHPILYWNYSDPEDSAQAAYWIQIDDNSDFSSLIKDTGWIDSSSDSFATTGINFSWDTTYYWRVKVKDDEGGESDWSSNCSFTTPLHAYPVVDFNWLPQAPNIEEEVRFFDQTTYYGGAAGASWSWTFLDANPSSSSFENPKTNFQTIGSKQVDLIVTDSDEYSCSDSDDVDVGFSLPEWKEIIPW